MNETIQIGNITLPVFCFDVLIAGSGAAGLNAADTLYDEGVRDIAIITEGLKAGTSRNTGSDKQTYYKLSLGGDAGDSVRALAQTLFAGGSADGDIALCEAAASVPCFMKLLRLGVPFPKNPWGEYVGYKTDHDPARRATSAGPYTSKFMTEALEARILSKNIKIFDHYQIVKLLTEENKAAGLVCLNLETADFTVFLGKHIIWATGGPAGIYENSVYPFSQNGATGAALEAGALGRNLTEWQYGLASVKPRWNVSGTFMQALPRFISTDANGNDEREFLEGNFNDTGKMLTCVFLKGYQWPFDTRKIYGNGKFSGNGTETGSSIIDIMVYLETAKGRKVFLDFRENPLGKKNLDFSCLSEEAHSYLEAAGACFGAPYERLLKMNSPAADFYRSHGTDLSKKPLEIALCAQHNNGGLAVDHWWRSNIEGLYAAGEAAATHGVYRPGGSALNAGQAGSMRAAVYIAKILNRKSSGKDAGAPGSETPVSGIISGIIIEQIREVLGLASSILNNNLDNAGTILAETRKKMSLVGGPFRDSGKINEALQTIKELRQNFASRAGIKDRAGFSLAFRLWDTLVCQEFYLSAMADFANQSGRSRGSALYRNKAGTLPLPGLPDELAFLPDDGSLNGRIQEIKTENDKINVSWRDVRPIPPADESFEVVWKNFREAN